MLRIASSAPSGNEVSMTTTKSVNSIHEMFEPNLPMSLCCSNQTPSATLTGFSVGAFSACVLATA
jgi:hypothetical protein